MTDTPLSHHILQQQKSQEKKLFYYFRRYMELLYQLQKRNNKTSVNRKTSANKTNHRHNLIP